MLIPVLIISSLVHIYSIEYMSHDPHNQRFFSYLSLFTFMMILLVTADNYLIMFVGWEGVGVCSYLLVNFWYTRIAANQSAVSALLTNRVGDCFLTIGMFTVIFTYGKKFMWKVFKFAKKIKYTNNQELHSDVTENGKEQKINYSLGPYLAGLIEGDGYIAVHNKDTKKKEYRPKIIIAFNIKDKPLADKLSAELKVGKVISKPELGHVILQILSKDEVLKIINLINGHMRTPKIEALHRAISWINVKDNCSIPLLGLDKSPLGSNAWLAGFTDADGNFSITIYEKTRSTEVQNFFRIEVKQNYSREGSEGGSSYFTIMSEISAFFTVNLYSRTRNTESKVFYAFQVSAHNSRSHVIVRNYFDNFPLLSSKYLAYKDWCLVLDLKKISVKDNLEKIRFIKSQFNSKRVVFNFTHLDSFHF